MTIAVWLAGAAARAQSPQFSTSQGRLHYERALRLGEKSMYRGAVLELTRALAYEPGNPDLLIELGIAWGGLKEWNNAIQALRRAAKLAPNSVRARYNLAVTLDRFDPGQHPGIPEYRKVLALNPNHVDSLINLASDIGDRDSAEAGKLLDRALKIDPEAARAHFNRALLTRNAGDRQRAIEGIQRAIDLEPGSIEFRKQLVSLLVAEGRAEEAIAQCQKMLALGDSDWNTHYTLGRMLTRIGREQEGEKELQIVEEIRQSEKNRESVGKFIAAGSAALSAGRPEEAVRQFRSALELDPKSADGCMYLGIALAASGRLEQAVEKLNQAISIDPGNARAHHNLGTVFLQTGRIDEARREFERALELDPYSPEAHNNLGLILAQNNDAKSAIGHFRSASELNPLYLEAFFNLGIALRSTGQLDDAVRVFRQAAKLAPESPQVHYALGMTLKDKGDAAGAQLELERAKTLQQQAGANANKP